MRLSVYRRNRESYSREDKRTWQRHTAFSYANLRNFGARQRGGAFTHLGEVKFIDRDPHWYTRRVKEDIYITLHPNKINRDSGIEIPEA